MSNKILCACGKQHRREQPLVITITACPKKKHPPLISTKQSSTAKKPSTSSGPQLNQPLLSTKQSSTTKKQPTSDGSQLNQPHLSTKQSSPTKHPTSDGSQLNQPHLSIQQSSTTKKHPTSDGSQLNQPHIGRKLSGSKKSSVSDREQSATSPVTGSQDEVTPNEASEISDHILLCEDAGVTVPSSSTEIPLIDNSTFCDMDEAKKSVPTADKETDSAGSKRQYKEESSAQVHKGNGTFFDPNHVIDTDEEHLASSSTEQEESETDHHEKSVDSLSDRSSRDKENKHVENDKKVPHTEPSKIKRSEDQETDKTSTPPLQHSNINEISNFPSDTEMRLPILVPRYHGPGCAMEVDVMEKHDHNCRYRKKKNPQRNPVDDRSGSYEVIGRLKFKTCHPETTLHQDFNKSNNTLHVAKVATIYSLFNIPYKLNSKKLCLSTSDSKRQLQKYLQRKKILEDLTKSSKSFSRQSKRCLEERRKVIKFEENTNEDRNVRSGNVTSCEVEVLYFYDEDKCNKSVQFSRTSSSKFKFKKWFYYIFPCVSMEESQTLLLTDANRSSG